MLHQHRKIMEAWAYHHHTAMVMVVVVSGGTRFLTSHQANKIETHLHHYCNRPSVLAPSTCLRSSSCQVPWSGSCRSCSSWSLGLDVGKGALKLIVLKLLDDLRANTGGAGPDVRGAIGLHWEVGLMLREAVWTSQWYRAHTVGDEFKIVLFKCTHTHIRRIHRLHCWIVRFTQNDTKLSKI
jgi:hypothetical protein